MARGGAPTVEIEGLRDLRRDLRAISNEAAKDVQAVIKRAVSRVAEEAARQAPKQSGALAASYKPFTSGNLAGVRSRLPYAPIVEFGGTIAPKGAEIRFDRRLIVTRAAEREADKVVKEIGDGIEASAKRHGWH